MKMTTRTTQEQYQKILHHINRYVIDGWGAEREERLKKETEEREKDRQDFKDFYAENKDFVDRLESERISNNNYSFGGELTASKLEYLLDDENAPFPKLGKNDADGEYTPSDHSLYSVVDDGEFLYGFDPFEVDGYTFTHIKQHGGGGEGDQYWVVFKVSKDGVDRYFKWYGWYTSYDGGHLEDIFEVEPKEVTVTQYEKLS